jgi:hypothetical protein
MCGLAKQPVRHPREGVSLAIAVTVGVDLQRDRDPGVAKDLHRIALWDSQRLEQRGHRMTEVVEPDLAQACPIDQPLERADQVTWLDRLAAACGEHQVIASP